MLNTSQLKNASASWPVGVYRLRIRVVDAVAASIKEFGFRAPIVVDANDVIIVGGGNSFSLFTKVRLLLLRSVA
jgi:hypothetical protein